MYISGPVTGGHVPADLSAAGRLPVRIVALFAAGLGHVQIDVGAVGVPEHQGRQVGRVADLRRRKRRQPARA